MMPFGAIFLYSCCMGLLSTLYMLVSTLVKHAYKDRITPGMKVAEQFCMWLVITSAWLHVPGQNITKFDALAIACVVALSFLVHDTKRRLVYSGVIALLSLFVRFYLP